MASLVPTFGSAGPHLTATSPEQPPSKSPIPSARVVAADVASALGASFCVAPFIAMVDQAIIQNAAGTNTLTASLKESMRQLVTQPHRFLSKPAFLLLWGVYGGTYISLNLIQSACDAAEASNETRQAGKFVGVSVVNLGLNISKDRIFTRMFGAGVPRPVPVRAMGCFAARDALTVFASFNVAPVAAEMLAGTLGSSVAATSMQLTLPVAMQWFSAPIHLMGLDLYNRPGKALAERGELIRRLYVQTAAARSARIMPAFGVGAVLNTPLRTWLLAKAKAQEQWETI